MSNTRLSGLVAEILNDREVAVNIGEERGVKIGMQFKIMDLPRTLKDPKTGESLGEVQKEKIKIKAVDVHPKFFIGRTYETYQQKGEGLGLGFSLPAWGRPTITKVRTLRQSDSAPNYEPLDQQHSFVKIGDPVVLLDE